MIVDKELVDYIHTTFGKDIDVEKIVENCGIWCSLDGIRAEWEYFEATLEDVMEETYFIVQDNKMFFCSSSQIFEDIAEFIENDY